MRLTELFEDLDDKDEFGTACLYHNCSNRDDRDTFHTAHTAGSAETQVRYGQYSAGVHDRPWGVDPEEWMKMWEEVMGKHGYVRTFEDGKLWWVKK